MKDWRKAINRNVDYYKKELEIIKRNQVKLEDSFTRTKSELKAINSKLEDRILKITPSEKQSERQKKWKQYVKAVYETCGIMLFMPIFP